MQSTIKQINSAKEPIIYCDPKELQGYIFGVYETVTMGAKSDTRTMPLFPAPPEIESTRQMIMPELLEKMGWVQKQEWVGLTDEEIKSEAKYFCNGWYSENPERLVLLVKTIQAKLKEKNGG